MNIKRLRLEFEKTEDGYEREPYDYEAEADNEQAKEDLHEDEKE